ncbi:hypothetical protein GV789_28835, partial [Nocardia cyriacigeorgica]
IAGIEDTDARALAETVCDLFVYATLEENLSWFIMHRFMSVSALRVTRRFSVRYPAPPHASRHSWIARVA